MTMDISMTEEESIDILNRICPCRENVIQKLLCYMTLKDTPATTNSLFLYGNTGSGKSHVVKTMVDRLQVCILAR